jgi:hypothetical protein
MACARSMQPGGLMARVRQMVFDARRCLGIVLSWGEVVPGRVEKMSSWRP